MPAGGAPDTRKGVGVYPGGGWSYSGDRVCSGSVLSSQNDGFKTTKAGTLSVDPITLTTHIPGVFAGGDLVSGPSTVVEAMAGGYRAAISIDRYLKGKDLYQDRAFEALERAEVPKAEEEAAEQEAIKPRARMRAMTVDRRVCTFEEVNLGFDEETAIREAKRCLRCDLER